MFNVSIKLTCRTWLTVFNNNCRITDVIFHFHSENNKDLNSGLKKTFSCFSEPTGSCSSKNLKAAGLMQLGGVYYTRSHLCSDTRSVQMLQFHTYNSLFKKQTNKQTNRKNSVSKSWARGHMWVLEHQGWVLKGF